jgi:hypothetical protein
MLKLGTNILIGAELGRTHSVPLYGGWPFTQPSTPGHEGGVTYLLGRFEMPKRWVWCDARAFTASGTCWGTNI